MPGNHSAAPHLAPARVQAADEAPLILEQTIALPDIKGRIDHLAVDLVGKRLFVAASCGAGFLEVFRQTDPYHYVILANLATPTERAPAFWCRSNGVYSWRFPRIPANLLKSGFMPWRRRPKAFGPLFRADFRAHSARI